MRVCVLFELGRDKERESETARSERERERERHRERSLYRHINTHRPNFSMVIHGVFTWLHNSRAAQPNTQLFHVQLNATSLVDSWPVNHRERERER